MSKKIIVFDFDGVIADSFRVALAVSRLAMQSLEEDDYRAMFNGNINDAKHTSQIVKEIDFAEEYGKRFLSLGIDPDVKKIIMQLRKQFPLFIISSTITPIIAEYLTRHNIRDCFADILGNDVAKSKVEKFTMLFEKTGYLPTNTIFLTDTAGDVAEGRASNINFIVGILGGYQNRKALEASRPDAIVEDMSDFYALVQETGTCY